MVRRLLLALALLALTVPAGSQLNKKSHGARSGQQNISAGAALEVPISTATACWTFDDPTDVGNDDCTDTYDLTNTTVGSRGSSYTLTNDGTEGRRAAADDSAPLSAAGGSFTVCFWTKNDNPNDNDFYVGKDDWGSQREWHFRNDGLQPALYYSRNCNSYEDSASTGVNLVAGERNFVCGWYDSSTKKGTAWANGTEGNTATAMATDMGDCTSDFVVGDAETSGSNRDPLEGTVGPVYWWKGEVVADATLDALYNSGKGMDCAAAAEVDTMTACWDLDEDPADGAGAYKDSVGSEDMSPEGSPLRRAGLVAAGDAGLVAEFNAITDTLINTAYRFDTSTSLSVSYWIYREALPASNAWSSNENIDANPGLITYTLTDGRELFFVRSTTSQAVALAADTSPESAWVHVCGYATVGDKAYLRVNGGAITAEAALTGTALKDSESGIRFSAAPDGGNPYSSSNGEEAWLDDYIIWNTNIGQAGCDAIYAAGQGGR